MPRETSETSRLLQLSRALEDLAYDTARTLEHVTRELRDLDGHKAATLGGGPARTYDPTTDLTLVERIANARFDLTSTRDQIRDDILTLETLIASYRHVLDRGLRHRAPTTAGRYCDGRNLPGSDLRWTPNAHGNNGWFDPACRRPTMTTLCDRCEKRYARWSNRSLP